MKTPSIGFFGVLVSSLLVACGGAVTPAGGNGAGGENEGGSELGGESSIGGSDAAGGAGEGGVGGGALVGGEGGVGEGGAPAEACALMEQVSISDPALVDAGGDLVWSPGETATFAVTLTNNAAVDNFNYPGVGVTSDLFGIESGDNTLFGLLAGEGTQVMVTVTASDAFQTGTDIELVFNVTTLSEGCEPGTLDFVELTVTLE